MQKKRKRTRKRKAQEYDVRICLYRKDAFKIKQVIVVDDTGHYWAADILQVTPVR